MVEHQRYSAQNLLHTAWTKHFRHMCNIDSEKCKNSANSFHLAPRLKCCRAPTTFWSIVTYFKPVQSVLLWKYELISNPLSHSLIYTLIHIKSTLLLRLCESRASFPSLTALSSIGKEVRNIKTSTSNSVANVVVRSAPRQWSALWMLLEMSALKAMANVHQSQQYRREYSNSCGEW